VLKMRQIIITFILTYVLIYSGLGLDIKTDASVVGNGYLYSWSNNNGLEDMANGSGEQTFSRSLQSADEIAKLTSKYIYIKGSSSLDKSNTHYASGQSDVGITQYANIVSNGSMESKVELEKTDDSIKTNFVLRSDFGHLTEGVIDSQHGATKFVEETELVGDLTFSSTLSEKLNIRSDTRGLSYKVEEIELMDSYEVKNGQRIPKAIGGGELSREDSSIIYRNEANRLYLNASALVGPNRTKTLEWALDNITQALELNQNYFDAWLLEGNILKSLERFEAALNSFEEADKINSNIETLRGKADSLFKLKRYPESIRALDAFLKLDPTDIFALNMKGKSYLIMGKLPDAKKVFDAALLLYPGNPSLKMNMGLVQLALNNSTESKNESKGLIKEALALGLKNEDPASAEDAENKLSALSSPEDNAIDSRNEASRLYQNATTLVGSSKTKTLELALDKITQALELNKNYFDAWLLKGNILLPLDRFDEALAAYDEAYKIRPNEDALSGKAMALFKSYRYEEAISISDEFLRLKPNDVAALNMKGKSYYSMGRISDAYDIYNLSLSMYPTNPNLLYNMGLVQLARGKSVEAKEYLKSALDSGLEEANPVFAADAKTKIGNLG
jgi:tetratricopeptide (TPR) repeat protein